MGILDRLNEIKKSSKLESKILKDRFENSRTLTKTSVPAINFIMSGKYDGGFYGGLTMLAAPSKHFKSGILLLAMKAYLDQNKDALAIFYDSENGAAKPMFEAYGYTEQDLERILWVEIANLEELQHHLIPFLTKNVEKGDKVFIGIDSVGNLASIKEVTDMEDGKSVADMTRARQFKALWRAATPFFNRYDIPCVAVNHVYQTLEMYSKTIMSGGTGGTLSADSVIFLTKSVNKEGKEIEGFNFTLVANKSRFIREGTKIPLTISFEEGIDESSGLLDLGLYLGCVEKQGIRYFRKLFDPETGEVIEDKDPRKRKMVNKKWFDEYIYSPIWNFKEKAEEYFQLSSNKLLSTEEEDEILDSVFEEEDENED